MNLSMHDATRIIVTLYMTYYFMPWIEWFFGMVEYA